MKYNFIRFKPIKIKSKTVKRNITQVPKHFENQYKCRNEIFTGRLVEDMENKIRSTLNEIYFGKTRDIVNGLRSVQPLAEAKKTKDLQVSVN